MDFSKASATELGAALDRIGFTWEFDDDGDIFLRNRLSPPEGYSAASYKMVQGYSIAGQFLDAEVTINPDGSHKWEVRDDGYPFTAVVQNVVKIYLMPRLTHLTFQIHAKVIPQNMEVSFPISIAPSEDQIENMGLLHG